MLSINNFLSLRAKQTGRVCRNLGIFRCLFMFCLLAALLLQLVGAVRASPIWQWGLFFGLMLWFGHIARSDLDFLKLSISNYRYVLWAEYTILQLPILVFLLAIQNFGAAGLLLGLILLMPYAPSLGLKRYKLKGYVYQLTNIKWLNFEAKAGLRRSWLAFLLLYALILGFMFFEGAFFIGVVLFTLLLSQDYNAQEDYAIFQSRFEKSSLCSVVGRQILFLRLLLLPCELCFLLYHGEAIWYLVFPEIAFTSVLMAFAVVYKYSMFWPDAQGSVSNSLPIALFLMGLCVPFFIPVCIWQLITRWRLAQKRVNMFAVYE
ncbi:MAG: hypothetical protein EAZ57_08690 [Cytophagales bacterium]|nr:MAG: hypothetical protein EAZ67_09500 [Cytophagales bacterium]TAF60102.1 MAG: hypothetical protein EAZ57_08690 [Cytophagales bacterium]